MAYQYATLPRVLRQLVRLMLSLAQWKKLEPGTFRDANTACETAEAICWTVASIRQVVAALRTGRTSAGFDEDGRSSTVALFSAGFDLVSRRGEEIEILDK